MIPRYSLPEMSELWSEQAHFQRMLQIEIYVCEALAQKGMIPKTAYQQIKSKARFDVKNIQKIEAKTRHDVMAFVNDVASKVGPAGRFIHMGVTSSDMLDTALALGMKQAGTLLIKDVKRILKAIKKQAKKYKYVPMVGRTHGVHADAITFGLKLALFYDEMQRNLARLERATDEVGVGKISGAVGTYANIEPFVEKYVCKKLGLKAAPVSSQIVLRDIHAEFLSTLAIIASSLERFAVEIRHLHRTEVREVEEPFGKGQTGSSAMPHKKNPIICERMAGQARLMRSYAQVALENITLWHERDISHSSAERVIVPDSTILLDYMLDKFTFVVENMKVSPERMREHLSITGGIIFSQPILLKLVKKGLKRKDAYTLVQEAAMDCWRHGIGFEESALKSKKIGKYLSEGEIKDCFNLDKNLQHVDYIFKKVGI